MFFGNNSKYPVGLDISDLSLKMVQLNKTGDKLKIQAMGRHNLPEGVIDNGVIKNKTALIKAIKKLMSSPAFGKVSSKEIITCLPESKTFVKLIDIPKSPNNLADIIAHEAEKHIPLPLQDIYFDWQIIENLPDKNLVLLGAAAKDIVNQYSQLLDEAKLTPLAMEVEPIAISRCLLLEESPNQPTASFLTKKSKQAAPAALGNYAILDIGASHTCMVFYSKNTILFTVSLPISGEKITNNIMQILKFDKLQAEKAKIACGFAENKAQGVIKNLLRDMVDELLRKINESMAFYNQHYEERGPLKKILLCGGGANMENLTNIISQTASLEVVVGDALIKLSEKKEKFASLFNKRHELDKSSKKDEKNPSAIFNQDTSSTYATAMGLALRGIYLELM